MAAIIRPLFHYSIAESIYEKIQTQTALYYYYIGKILPWEGEENLIVPDPENTQEYENNVRNNMVTLKQITINDVAICTRRIDWTINTRYDQYDDIDINLGAKNFYVLTNDYNVYKCLSNNYNAQSTTKPSGQDLGSFETADGYVWKFMYFIPLILRNKFLIPSHMPVTRKAKNQYYSSGVIESFIIANGGSAYDPNETSATVSGDGSGASVTLQIEGGVITGVIIVNGGSGYTNATLNIIKGEEDPGQDGNITLILSSPGDLNTFQADVETYAISGGISHFVVTNGSGGYTTAPSVTITGDGSGATAESVINGSGLVTSIIITNPGVGYTYADVEIATEIISGGEAAATARGIISPFGGHGFNAPKELFADTLCFYTSFTNVLNHAEIPITHDYRQFGIVSNIQSYGNATKYNSATASACYILNGVFTEEEYPADSYIYTSGEVKNLQVVTALDNKMLVLSLDGTIPEVGDVYTNDQSLDFTVTSLTEPNVNKFSGDMLFIDNSVAFESSVEQEISFRTFIKL